MLSSFIVSLKSYTKFASLDVSELIHVVGRVGKSEEGLDVHFGEANGVEEGLSLRWIHATLTCLLKKHVLLNVEILLTLLHLVDQGASEDIGHFRHSSIGHIRTDPHCLEVLYQLAWYFPQDLLGEHGGIPRVLQEWHELDDVSCLVGAESLRIEWSLIGIQGLHA